MKTEVYDTPKAFLAALQGKKKAKAKDARPGLPRADRSAPTGLTSLIAGKARAWSLAFEVTRGYRLYVIGRVELDTGWQPSEKAACDAAKALS